MRYGQSPPKGDSAPMRFNKLFFVTAAAAVTGTASAAVIDFNGHPNDFDQVIVEAGYEFTFSAQGWGVIEDSFPFAPPFTQNGTTRLVASGGFGPAANVVFKPLDDSAFNLVGMDVAAAFAGTTNTIDVIGFLEGGGEVSTSFAVGDPFTNAVLPSSFENLDRVQVFSGTIGPFPEPGFALDNIEVNPVPEPSALTVLLLGAGALLLRRKKK